MNYVSLHTFLFKIERFSYLKISALCLYNSRIGSYSLKDSYQLEDSRSLLSLINNSFLILTTPFSCAYQFESSFICLIKFNALVLQCMIFVVIYSKTIAFDSDSDSEMTLASTHISPLAIRSNEWKTPYILTTLRHQSWPSESSLISLSLRNLTCFIA